MFIHYPLPLQLHFCSCFIGNQFLISFFFFQSGSFLFQFMFKERSIALGWLAVSYTQTTNSALKPEGATHNMTSADREDKKNHNNTQQRLVPKFLIHNMANLVWLERNDTTGLIVFVVYISLLFHCCTFLGSVLLTQHHKITVSPLLHANWVIIVFLLCVSEAPQQTAAWLIS